MSTKPVTTRANTATRAGCVRHGMGHKMPFSGCNSWSAAKDDPRPNILQLNTEGLTANKISVIEQLAYKIKAFIIVLQETHCTTADKLVITNFSLAGSVLSRNYGLAMFVHELLEWSLVDQSLEQSETEWLCGYKLINVCKPPRSPFTPTHHSHHPDVPSHEFAYWWLQLPTCQLGLQQNISQQWEPGLLGNIQQHWTVVWTKGTSQFLLLLMERQHQPRSRLRKFWPGKPDRRFSWKVPAVITSALPPNATKTQDSCPQRSSEALELSQGWLEVYLPSYRWIHWEIATSGHIKYWKGIPGFSWEPTIWGQTM